jgi:Lipase (class 3)
LQGFVFVLPLLVYTTPHILVVFLYHLFFTNMRRSTIVLFAAVAILALLVVATPTTASTSTTETSNSAQSQFSGLGKFLSDGWKKTKRAVGAAHARAKAGVAAVVNTAVNTYTDAKASAKSLVNSAVDTAKAAHSYVFGNDERRGQIRNGSAALNKKREQFALKNCDKEHLTSCAEALELHLVNSWGVASDAIKNVLVPSRKAWTNPPRNKVHGMVGNTPITLENAKDYHKSLREHIRNSKGNLENDILQGSKWYMSFSSQLKDSSCGHLIALFMKLRSVKLAIAQKASGVTSAATQNWDGISEEIHTAMAKSRTINGGGDSTPPADPTADDNDSGLMADLPSNPANIFMQLREAVHAGERQRFAVSTGYVQCPNGMVTDDMFMNGAAPSDLAALAYNSPQPGHSFKPAHPAATVKQVTVKEYHAPVEGKFVFDRRDLTTPYLIATSEDTIYVSWRGTNNIVDWTKNLAFDMTPLRLNGQVFGHVHLGFLAAYLQHPNFLYHFTKVLQDFSQKPKLVVTGHSLGAAIAQICAFDLSLQGFKSKNGEVWSFTPTVYSFGSPRYANIDLREAFGRRVHHYRFVNNHDVVPSVPPFGPKEGASSQFEYYWHTGDVSIIYNGDASQDVHYSCFDESIALGHQHSVKDHSMPNNYQPKTNAMGAFGEKGQSASRVIV